MLRLPLVSDLRLAFTCLMRPRDGVAYVAARIFHAARAVVARAIKGIMVGVIDPMMAFEISWS